MGLGDSRELGPAVQAYAAHFRVFAPDRRGYGRTPDVPGPFTYEVTAADTVAFLEPVVGGSAHLVGYSDGATPALHVALRRPDLVRSLVLMSGQFHHTGLLPGMFGSSEAAAADWRAWCRTRSSPSCQAHRTSMSRRSPSSSRGSCWASSRKIR
ncbi:alpha/beta fold hydrolase [Pseudonocardia sp. CA-142604]|uniref:alpha/beta fold hydrolase n=1 Tax=Pseudonocardia sp. CA-142604 TaxID=3240024 RepID=UPI003D901DFA